MNDGIFYTINFWVIEELIIVIVNFFNRFWSFINKLTPINVYCYIFTSVVSKVQEIQKKMQNYVSVTLNVRRGK